MTHPPPPHPRERVALVGAHCLQRQANPPKVGEGAFTLCDKWLEVPRGGVQYGPIRCSLCYQRFFTRRKRR